MRKLLVVFLVVLLLVVFVVGALPVSAERGQPGEPPGWSYTNPGQGGTDNPGPGPGSVDGASP